VHDLKLVRTVTSAKCRLPFVSFGDADQVVGSAKVDLRENARGAQAVEEVGNQWKGVAVLLGDSVETAVVDREAKRSVLLLDEKDRGAGRGLRGSNEVIGEVLVYEQTKGGLLDLGEGVNRPEGGSRAVFQLDFVVVRTARWQRRASALAEDVQVVVVSEWDDLIERLIFVVRRVELGGSSASGDG
jgi:hypothetical protein